MQKNSKIFVAGHKGLVGSAIVQNLVEGGYDKLLLKDRKELDLLNQQAVDDFFRLEKPEYVFLAAAKVGGIQANNIYRGDFIYQNMMIQNNIIHASYKNDVRKLLFLGSSCVYPRNAGQPISEDSLLTDVLEYTNEPYAIAKIAGLKMCESYNLQYNTNFISVMPTNLYGENDNFDLETSHVLPALIRKIFLAKCLMNSELDLLQADFKLNPTDIQYNPLSFNDFESLLEKFGIFRSELILWGSGKPLREFLHVKDMVSACMFLMKNVDFRDILKIKGLLGNDEVRNTHLNIGTSSDISIAELSEIIKDIIGYKGNIRFDTSKPDGTPKKQLDTALINQLSWKPSIELKHGIEMVYKSYLDRLIE